MHKIHDTRITVTILTLMLLITNTAIAAEAKMSAELFMRDGQLKSHPVRVFVTNDISEVMKPRLVLVASHAVTKQNSAEAKPIEPKLIARGQRTKQKVQGEDVVLTGTLLLFDLKDYPFPPYKGMMRVVPVLKWDEKRDGKMEEHTLIGPHQVNIGNIMPTALWTVFIIGLLIATIVFVARQSGKKAICLLCGSMGRLSLANTQVALWTIGVGTMIAGYGFMRFAVPDVPESLVALMGLSFATGGISQYRESSPDEGSEPPPPATSAVEQQPRLFHLVSELKTDGREVLSLPRAQMVFWTGITLTLFTVKSLLDGVLWAVPWEMVAFMGMSQLGYLSPKWMPKGSQQEEPK